MNKSKGNKTISIIIPTYKGSSTIERAVQSALNQSYQYLEIIVVDDNDPHSYERAETEKAITPLLSDKVQYIKHEKNKNGSAARNTGIRKSTGEYIMFLDDDDEFLPYKAEKQIADLEEHDSDWGANYTNYEKHMNMKCIEIGNEHKTGQPIVDQLARNLFIQGGSNLMIRREVIDKVGYFDETFNRNQDIEYITRILLKYKLSYVDYVGLVVHLKANRSNDSFTEITQKYKHTFKDVIEQTGEQAKIYEMLDLQVLRYLLQSKQMKEFLEYKKDSGVAYRSIFTYFGHLLIRKIRRKCYGYKI